MKTMEITKEVAKKLHPKSEDWFKEKLESAFGVEIFKGIDFTTFRNFDDLCQACGTTEREFNEKWSRIERLLKSEDVNIPKMKQDDEMAILVKAYNQDWVADPLNTSQKKWYPYFSVSSSGLGFSASIYDYDLTFTDVGSRFAFENEAKPDQAGKTFTKFFEQFITNKLN